MTWKLKYTKKAKNDLRILPKEVGVRIFRKIEFYSKQENPLHHAKTLKINSKKRYRFRIGEYRAIFRIDKKGEIKILMILRISHRKNIYIVYKHYY